MKRFPLIAILVLSVAAVMAVSFEVLRRSRTRVVQEFDVAQQRLARDTATALAARLSAFDRDGTLLADLVERTRREGGDDRAWQDREILAACQALATTVSHYRTIGVFGSAGAAPIVAVDPTEEPSHTVPLLVEASVPIAVDASKMRHPSWRGPVSVAPNRSFYLYATPAGASEAVVMTIDVALLLQDVLRPPPAGAQYIVADAASVMWIDCESANTCRRGDLERPAVAPTRPPAPGTPRVLGRGRVVGGRAPPADSIDRLTPAAQAVQVLASGADTILATTQSLTTPLGVWSLILRSSTTAIDARQRGLLWQLILTSAGVIAAMLSVGVFIVRQQRTAAALEVELKAARQLADLRERSDKILDNVSVGVLGATRQGRVVFANRFLQQHKFPVSGPNDSGDNTKALTGWTSRLRPHIERALTVGRTGFISGDDPIARSPDGPTLFVRVVPLNRPVEDVEALVLVEDLSELHELRRQLIRAEKLVTVGVLSAGIAHEVGTPLMVIRGHAEHLLERVGASHAAARGLESIMAQIDRISNTIRRVLEFSRTQPTLVTPTLLPQAIARATELLEWRFRTKRISVLTRSETALPALAADSSQLEQVLVNLLMNACDASLEDGVIEIIAASTGSAAHEGAPPHTRIDIVDHGSGIRPEHINAIFDPYFTTKKAGEGTGLGLTIVSQIVHNHGGELSINATPGGGTTVSVLWPTASLTPP